MSTKILPSMKSPILPSLPSGLLEDLQHMIDHARASIATTVNERLTILYWHVGKRIKKEILNGERAEYGQKIVATVSQQLVLDYGKSFTDKNLRRMIQFAEVFPDEQIVVSLIRQLSWTHFIALIPIKDDMKRDFYAEMCRIERWNVKTLRAKIDSMLYERTALSKKPEALVQAEIDALRKEDRITPDLVFRDPYVLEFLNLDDRYLEKDLEDSIMRELEQFLLELGAGFCFLARQKRITIDDEDFKLDLLFFHRDLKRLIAIDLKLGNFKPEHKGQMELYLRWLDKYERRVGEESPLGLILCAGKKEERIELLELNKSGIHVAEYLTVFPSKAVLREKLLKAIKRARKRLQHKDTDE
jgi:predicted nuclease of restriction endonuclease-like (RecB) superfamily